MRPAQTEQGIRAAIIIGSRARFAPPADEWADLDIVVIATDAKRYWSTDNWVENIGNLWLTFAESKTNGPLMVCRVLFEGGLDVDFIFLSVDSFQQMVNTEVPSDDAEALFGGERWVLLDKDGLATQLPAPSTEAQPSKLPTQPEFLEVVNSFWFHIVWTAKHLRRGFMVV